MEGGYRKLNLESRNSHMGGNLKKSVQSVKSVALPFGLRVSVLKRNVLSDDQHPKTNDSKSHEAA
jgi:hypothetical protein